MERLDVVSSTKFLPDLKQLVTMTNTPSHLGDQQLQELNLNSYMKMIHRILFSDLRPNYSQNLLGLFSCRWFSCFIVWTWRVQNADRQLSTAAWFEMVRFIDGQES
jgi:hypothetical protein